MTSGGEDLAGSLVPVDEGALRVAPALAIIEAQAEAADRSRRIDPSAIDALRHSGVLAATATEELGGAPAGVEAIGRELEAVAARCASTAWCLWNHLAVFHLFVGALGPGHSATLAELVAARQWVCFPAGAGSGVLGTLDATTGTATVNGSGAFGSGGRYADWAGVVFAVAGADGTPQRPLDLRFTIVPTDDPGVRIEQTWDGAAVRASATDDLHYRDVVVPLDRCVPWYGANRAETLREVPVVSARYREDWVGLSDLWLVWMGVGLVRAALLDAAGSIRTRKAIMGKAMVSRPTVQVNLGRAAALVAGARATAESGCREVDDRIASGRAPGAAEYLRQMALATAALAQLGEAMALLLRTQGGNGLRESGTFERRWRDFHAMPLHINAHLDRVTHQLGRFALGEDLEPF
jgi:3-hydroxy-9,10-secoandrosta-1,3,5(10)-triene-9,17-dione monooxygenase